jgi:hypothetical protein
MFQQTFGYLSEAVVRIFAPANDHYPATGMVPFMGDVYNQSPWVE